MLASCFIACALSHAHEDGVASPPRTQGLLHPPTGGTVHAADDGASEEAAIRERVDNIRVTPISRARAPRGQRAAVERFKLWENGRRLRVRFLDGLADVQEKVATIAKEWEDVANIHLDFVASTTAELRISFAEKGFSWSTVGTDPLHGPAHPPDDELRAGSKTDTPIREYERVVRHEFGHALGMIHEHQNPAAAGQIPWEKPKVYAYYAQQGWTEEDVDQNIFDVYDEDSTNFTEFDPTSIMQYRDPRVAHDRHLLRRLEHRALRASIARSWPSNTRRMRLGWSSSPWEASATPPTSPPAPRSTATTSTRRTRCGTSSRPKAPSTPC